MFLLVYKSKKKSRSFSQCSTVEYSHQEISAEPHSPGSTAEVEASQINKGDVEAKHWQNLDVFCIGESSLERKKESQTTIR